MESQVLDVDLVGQSLATFFKDWLFHVEGSAVARHLELGLFQDPMTDADPSLQQTSALMMILDLFCMSLGNSLAEQALVDGAEVVIPERPEDAELVFQSEDPSARSEMVDPEQLLAFQPFEQNLLGVRSFDLIFQIELVLLGLRERRRCEAIEMNLMFWVARPRVDEAGQSYQPPVGIVAVVEICLMQDEAPHHALQFLFAARVVLE